MPELPEVETVRRGLEPAMSGHRISRLVQRRPDLRFPLPDHFADRLTGRRIESLARRAKYLLAHLDGGEVLIMHLGMSGRFTVAPSFSAPDRDFPSPRGGVGPVAANGNLIGDFTYDTGTAPIHDHVVFEMENGATVTYNDPRRFGFMDLVAADGLEDCKHFAGMGPEPLGNGFNSDYLARRAQGRAADLKAFLLDQRNIAGLGNIYVCEALFRSGLSPNRSASCLADRRGRPTDRCERLVPTIRQVLEEAIAAGGSTLRDYAHADGSLGYFQHSFKVYGREGEPCTKAGCEGTIKRTVQSGRSTFHCGRCQR
jgi:formamidopyrimidine-DNA glycosylase